MPFLDIYLLGYQDSTIKIYFNLKDQKSCITIKGHKVPIVSICSITNGKIISCSEDKTIKMWYIDINAFVMQEKINYACTKTFTN